MSKEWPILCLLIQYSDGTQCYVPAKDYLTNPELDTFVVRIKSGG